MNQPDSQAGDDTQLYNKVSELVRWNGWTLSNDEATAALVELAKRYAERLATNRVIEELRAMQLEWYGKGNGELEERPNPETDWLGADLYDRIATLTKEASDA